MADRNIGAAVAPAQLTRTQVQPVGQGKGAVDQILKVMAYVVLLAVTAVMFVPFAFTLVTSLKTNREANNLTFANLFWPDNPSLDAYRTVFDADVGRWFLNSAFVAVLWVFGRCVFDTMAGYAFARMQFPGRQLVFLAILSTLMVPGIVLIIPRFIILDRLNLLNSNFYTLPLGLAFFRYEFKTDWPTQMAIAVITTVPIAIFFIIFQRYFVESNAS